MTRSLREALHDAADDSGSGWHLTPDETLELARRRTRHNRWARPLLAAGVVAGIAGGALTLPRVFYPAPTAAPTPVTRTSTAAPTPNGTPTLVGPVPSSRYEPKVISVAEVKSRCRRELGRIHPGASFTPVTNGPFVEGESIRFRSGDRLEECRIPYQDAGRPFQGVVPAATAHDTIKSACSQVLGYDLTGWRVVTTASAHGVVVSVLAASNGWDAQCLLVPQTWIPLKHRDTATQQSVTVYRSDEPVPDLVREDVVATSVTATPSQKVSVKVGSNHVTGALVDLARTAVLSWDGGLTINVPVVDGRFAYATVLAPGVTVSGPRMTLRDASGRQLQQR